MSNCLLEPFADDHRESGAGASSVGFEDSTIYGLGTLWTLTEFVLDRLGWVESDQFRKPPEQVMSNYDRARVEAVDN